MIVHIDYKAIEFITNNYAVEIIITFCVKLLRFGLSSYVLGNVTFCGPTAVKSLLFVCES